MAKKPSPKNPWINLFFGTSKRIFWTLVTCAVIVFALFPGAAIVAANRVIGPAMTIVIIVVALRLILGMGKK